MRVAIPVWNGRVSPVFDVARRIHLASVDRETGLVRGESIHTLRHRQLASDLRGLGVEVVICSAVTPSLEALLWVSGVEVISDVCGRPEEIVRAFAAGDTALDRFRAPGSKRCSRPKLSRSRAVMTGRLDAPGRGKP